MSEGHKIQAVFSLAVNDIFIPQFSLTADSALKGDWNNDGKDEFGIAHKKPVLENGNIILIIITASGMKQAKKSF